ncbi:MAG: hypothetical protein GXO79_14150 [Chlorobi bacterium]|nr:hypothetical protein [Chlorobiota bacterium]
MKQFIVFLSGFLILLIIQSIGFSQDCFEYYKQCEEYNKKHYKYDDNTTGLFLSSYKPDTVIFEAVTGINYKISICADSISIPLHFIIENEENEILFDNSSDNLTQVFEFSVNNYKKLSVIVDIDKTCNEQITNCSGCMAVIIEKAIKPRTGF